MMKSENIAADIVEIDETNDSDDDRIEDRDKKVFQKEIDAAFNLEGETENSFTKDLENKILGVGYSYEEDHLNVRVREKLFNRRELLVLGRISKR